MWKILTNEFGCTVPWIEVPGKRMSNICHPARMNGTIGDLLDRFGGIHAFAYSFKFANVNRYKAMTTTRLLDYCELPCSDMSFTFGIPETETTNKVTASTQ